MSPLSLGVYRNVFPDRLQDLAQVRQAGGTGPSIVHWFALWGGWKREFSRVDLDKVNAAGCVPFISWEPWAGNGPERSWSLREAILSGKNDRYIESWAQGLAGYAKPVLLRFAHEMHNQPAYPWAVGNNGNTAADYVAAWKHVRAIFARYETRNVQWVWNPNTLGAAPAAAHEAIYRELYPGDDLVDWVGLDIYNTGPDLDWGAPYWRSFNQIMDAPYQAITAVSTKPVILPEVGCTEAGGSKSRWIAETLRAETAQRYPRLRALIWFDVAKEQAWQLASSEASLQAWRGAESAPLVFGEDQSVTTLGASQAPGS